MAHASEAVRVGKHTQGREGKALAVAIRLRPLSSEKARNKPDKSDQGAGTKVRVSEEQHRSPGKEV